MNSVKIKIPNNANVKNGNKPNISAEDFDNKIKQNKFYDKTSKHDWPIETTGFRVENYSTPLRIPAKRVYCIHIPSAAFVEKATGFYSFRYSDPSALPVIAILQFWIFVVDVLARRIDKNRYKGSVYPFQVYLECLRDYEGNMTRSYRLWIFELVEDSAFKIAETFIEILNTPIKTPNVSGLFPKDNASGKQSAESSGKNSDIQMDGGIRNSSGTRSGMKTYSTPLLKLYKKLNNKGKYLMTLNAYYKRQLFENSTNAQVLDSVTSPDLTFSLDLAFGLTEDRICNLQKDISNYQINDGSQIKYKFPDTTCAFFLFPENISVDYFFTRVFPHYQLHEGAIAFTQRMQEMNDVIVKKKIEEFYGEKKDVETSPVSSQENSEKSKDSLDDDDDSSTPAMDLETKKKKIFSKVIGTGFENENGEDDDYIIDEEGDYNFQKNAKIVPNSKEERQQILKIYNSKKEELSADVIQGICDVCNLWVTASTNSNLDGDDNLDDYVSNLRCWFRRCEYIIGEYCDMTKSDYQMEMNTLVDLTLEKLQNFCTSSTSDVSEAQKKLNEFWHDKDLQNFHKAVPIVDVKLSILENYLIYLNECFSFYENVATYQLYLIFILIGISNRFSREMKLHLNFLLYGDGGVGKSVIIKNIIKQCLEGSCLDVSDRTDKADMRNAKDSDILVYKDDFTLTKFLENPSLGAAHKKHMTTQQTRHDVLEFVTDEHGNKERCQNTYENISIRNELVASNDSRKGLLEAAKGNQAMVVALLSRYVLIYIAKHNIQVRNIRTVVSGIMDTDSIRKKKKEFNLFNIKMHIMLAFAHKVMHISEHILKVDMSIFNTLWIRLEQEASKYGLEPEHNRVRELAYDWCKELVLKEALLINNFTEKSKYYKKQFSFQQFKEWIPVCMERHVILTFSFFYPNFYPECMNFVLQALQKIFTQALKTKNEMFYFPRRKFEAENDKTKTNIPSKNGNSNDNNNNNNLDKNGKSSNDKDAEDLDENNSQSKEKDSDEKKSNKKSQKFLLPGEGTGHNYVKKNYGNNIEKNIDAVADMITGIDDDTIFNDQDFFPNFNKKKTDPKANLVELQKTIDALKKADVNSNSAAAKNANAMSTIDASFLYFKGTPEQLIREIQVQGHGNPVEFSEGEINTCLEKLMNMKITNKQWVILQGYDSPVRNDIEVSNCGLRTDRYGKTHINYELINPDSIYSNLLEKIIGCLEHKHSSQKKVLLGVPNEIYPWIHKQIILKPNNEVMKLPNHHYIGPVSRNILYGNVDEKNIEEKQRHMVNVVNMDFDKIAFLNYIKNHYLYKTLSSEEACSLFPEKFQVRLKIHLMCLAQLKEVNENGEHVTFINYPKDLIAEYNTRKELFENKQKQITVDESNIKNMTQTTDFFNHFDNEEEAMNKLFNFEEDVLNKKNSSTLKMLNEFMVKSNKTLNSKAKEKTDNFNFYNESNSNNQDQPLDYISYERPKTKNRSVVSNNDDEMLQNLRKIRQQTDDFEIDNIDHKRKAVDLNKEYEKKRNGEKILIEQVKKRKEDLGLVDEQKSIFKIDIIEKSKQDLKSIEKLNSIKKKVEIMDVDEDSNIGVENGLFGSTKNNDKSIMENYKNLFNMRPSSNEIKKTIHDDFMNDDDKYHFDAAEKLIEEILQNNNNNNNNNKK